MEYTILTSYLEDIVESVTEFTIFSAKVVIDVVQIGGFAAGKGVFGVVANQLSLEKEEIKRNKTYFMDSYCVSPDRTWFLHRR